MRCLAFGALLLGLVACSNGAPKPGGSVACGDGARQALDCTSEVSYDGVKTEGGVSVLNIGGVKGSTEQVALHRINEQVEQYVAAHTRLCREYNACILSVDEYKARTSELAASLLPVSTAVQAINTAGSYGQRQEALAALYTQVVPAAQRVEEITLRMSVEAELPAALGGGVILLRPGEMLPTDARVAFTFEVSREAFLYIFQTTPSGEPTVLFPNPRIGTQNPLPGGTPRRIPSGSDRFRVNEKDLGLEHVYVVASAEPLANLDAVLAKVNAGTVTNVQQDPALTALAGATKDPKREGCAPPASTRGLELAPATPACTRGLELDAGEKPASLVTQTDPGDGVILQAFPFQHVAQPDYRKPAPKPAAPKSRGVQEEEELIQQ